MIACADGFFHLLPLQSSFNILKDSFKNGIDLAKIAEKMNGASRAELKVFHSYI